MSMTLRKMGCDVTIADNGVMAIDAFKNAGASSPGSVAVGAFDIVLMDGNMPFVGTCDCKS